MHYSMLTRTTNINITSSILKNVLLLFLEFPTCSHWQLQLGLYLKKKKKTQIKYTESCQKVI